MHAWWYNKLTASEYAMNHHQDHVVLQGHIIIDSLIPAQRTMRTLILSVGPALFVASMLHSVPTGNLLPATVPTVCADANSSVPTKSADRGSLQAVALVMDAASFLTEVSQSLGRST